MKFCVKASLKILVSILGLVSLLLINVFATSDSGYDVVGEELGGCYGYIIPTDEKLTAQANNYSFSGDFADFYFMVFSIGKENSSYKVEIYSSDDYNNDSIVYSYTSAYGEKGSTPINLKWKFGDLPSGCYYGKCYTQIISEGVITIDTSSICTFDIDINRDYLTFELQNDCYAIIDCVNNITGTVEIPDVYNGLPVTTITSYAFSGCKNITNILIHNSITSIQSSAFENCTALTSITIPYSVQSIGSSAFNNCISLESVAILPGVKSIGEDAFSNTAYYNDSNNWENDVLYIGNYLIKAKDTISGEYEIKDGTKIIAENAFYDCNMLTSVAIPDTVTSIGTDAFTACFSLTSVNIKSIASWCNIDFCGEYANPLFYAKKLHLNNSLQKNLIIPEGVTEIKPYTFYNCESIENLKLPKSLEKIGSGAFYCCSNIAMVAISDLTVWCNIAFSGCDENPLYYAGNLYLNGELVTDLVIPEGVTEIKSYAFYNCKSLTSVTIPNSVTSIGDSAFSDCKSLTSVTIPNSVTSIGDSAFSDCTSLSSVTIPNSVTSIGDDAFCFCESLTSVTIPDSVTSIGEGAFGGCNSLESFNVSPDNKNYSSLGGVLFNKNKTTLIQYPAGKKSTEYVIPGSVTSICDDAFGWCDSLTSVTIPNGVMCIGDGAFNNCFALTNVIIPDKVTSIGDYAFYDCHSLTSITIPDSVTSIGFKAFYFCDSLTSITIPNSVTSIGSQAFYNCTSLTSITLGDGVTTIESYAFFGCSALKYVFYTGSSTDWSSINIVGNNSKLTYAKIHYNSTGHSHNVTKNLPFFEGMEGSIEDVCPNCDIIYRSDKLVWLNDYITAVDTKNAVVDTTRNTLLLDMSACQDITEAIVEMDGYTLTTTPTSSYGFIGTGSKVQVTDTTGTQIAEYTLVVRGDVNGDSVCDSLDLMLIELARQTNNNVTLEGVYFTAANLAEDTEINIDDFNAVVNKAVALA